MINGDSFFEDIEGIINHCLEGARDKMVDEMTVVQDKLNFQLSMAEDELQDKNAEILRLQQTIADLTEQCKRLKDESMRKSLEICKLSNKLKVVPTLKQVGIDASVTADIPRPVAVKKEEAGKKSFTVPYKKEAKLTKEAKELNGALTELLDYFQETFPEAVADAEVKGSEKNPIVV